MNITQVLEINPDHLHTLPDIVPPLLDWFDKNARSMPWRDTPQPYWVWISEVMLQQTRVEAVRGYFDPFVTRLPTIQALAQVPEDELLKLWEGLGYYNRARNLKKAAKQIVEEFDGQLPPDYDQLLTLPGIGEYTAGAIASIAFGIAVPAIDGNVYRVISRLLASYATINTTVAIKRAYTKVVGDMLPPHRPGDFNQALMELGATVCIPNGSPRCEQCPIAFACQAREQNIAEELPIRPSKRPRTQENRTILLVTSPLGVLLEQRPSTGLLANLWQPVNLGEHIAFGEVENWVATNGLKAKKITPLDEALHIFSHIEWHMAGYHVEVSTANPPKGFCWAKSLTNHSVPSAFASYRTYLKTFWKEDNA